MKAVAITYTPYLTRAMAVLAGVIALSLFLYGIFLLEAVAHTASRTHSERTAAKHVSELSVLQARYLSLTKNITLDRAYDMGLSKPVHTTTIYADAGEYTFTSELTRVVH